MKNYLFILLLFVTSFLFAEGSGIIKGIVTDGSNSEPLVGVNILLEGTSIGAATDIDGNFKIQNLPEGKYSIKASFIGYNKTHIKNILVISDSITIVNIKLSSSNLELEAIIVNGQKPEMQVGLRASMSFSRVSYDGLNR